MSASDPQEPSVTDLSLDPVPPAPRRPWWSSAPALSLWVTLLLLGGVMGWPLLRGGASSASVSDRPAHGLPWQIRTDGSGGSEVFGLHLGRATLADVERLWGSDLKVTLIAAPGQAPALEAYVEGFQAAFVTGKLVVAFRAEATWLAAAWDRSPRHDIGEGAVRQHELSMDDLTQARLLPVAALSFVPSARLDEDTVLQRFGSQPERHTGPAGELQLLYAERGVAVALPPSEGEAARSRALIQYLPPADFEQRLRAPLLAASASSSASAPARQ